MNKKELIAAVAGPCDFGKEQTGGVLDAFFATVSDTLKNGDEVRIPGFGSFSVSGRAEKQGRNPQTGEIMRIPASRAVRFKAGKALKEALNG